VRVPAVSLAGRAIAATFLRERNEAGESALGALIADAHLDASRVAGAQVAFINPGGIRTSLNFNSSGAGEGNSPVTTGRRSRYSRSPTHLSR
jgi:5'-nucleotidase